MKDTPRAPPPDEPDRTAQQPVEEEGQQATRPQRPTSTRAERPTPAARAPLPPHGSDPRAREPSEAGTPRPGERVGRYVLLKQLGMGGMGAVYAAYDPELERRVALKLLLPERQDSPESAAQGRARLLREAQAMARVPLHPHVLPVFDVGTWDDQVFLTMELIDGGTLDDWMRGHTRPWREVLARFLQAGQGLAAAHAAGLVHRDFKPANVLLDKAGRAYVTDFGLARLTDLDEALDSEKSHAESGAEPVTTSRASRLHEALTQAGLVMGTPGYMPPEQYRGAPPDARSDQFSFCAALYRALYQQRPFDSRLMARRALAASPSPEAEPLIREPPRHVRVPTWLRRAVLRGLAPRPEERFASMHALLEALSVEQRLARRRRAAGVAGALVLALGGGGGLLHERSQRCAGADALMAEVWGPPARQRLETAFGATGQPFAQDMARRTAEVLDGYARQWARQRTEACRATRLRGVQSEELLARRETCLERRRQDVDALVRRLERADGALVEKSLELAWRLPALPECADAVGLGLLQDWPSHPDERARLEALGARVATLKVQLEAGDYTEAEAALRQLEPQVLAAGWLPLRAELRFYAGWLQLRLGQPEAAARALALAVGDADTARADRLRVRALGSLPYVHGLLQQPELADLWAQQALSALGRLGEEPVLASDLMNNLGNLALLQGRYEQARTWLEQARERLRQVLPPQHPKHLNITHTLGALAVRQGEHARAVALLTEALHQTQSTLGPRHPEVARGHGALAAAWRGAGNPAAALVHARARVELLQARLGPAHPQVADALDEEGMCLLGLGRHAEALDVYQRALALKRQAQGPTHPDLQYSLDGVGQALAGLGRTSEAIAALRQALSFTGVPPRALAESGFTLARLLWPSQPRRAPTEASLARAEASLARERFVQAGLPQLAQEVEAWLQSHPPPAGR